MIIWLDELDEYPIIEGSRVMPGKSRVGSDLDSLKNIQIEEKFLKLAEKPNKKARAWVEGKEVFLVEHDIFNIVSKSYPKKKKNTTAWKKSKYK